jgi:hypothetical protein
MERLQKFLRTVKTFIDEYRESALGRRIGYVIIIGLGFVAVLNLVVGLIAGIKGEWLVASGLVLLGGGFILVCELLFDYLLRSGGSGSGS